MKYQPIPHTSFPNCMVLLLSICTQQKKMENTPLFLLNYWLNYYLVFDRQPKIDSSPHVRFFFSLPQKLSSSLNSKYMFSDDNRLNMSLKNLRKYPLTPGLSLSLVHIKQHCPHFLFLILFFLWSQNRILLIRNLPSFFVLLI